MQKLKMRLKVRLFNICIRRKCSNIDYNGNEDKSIPRKITRLKKTKSSQYISDIPTLKNVPSSSIENQIQQSNVDEYHSSSIIHCTSDILQSKDKGNDIPKVGNNLFYDNHINMPDVYELQFLTQIHNNEFVKSTGNVIRPSKIINIVKDVKKCEKSNIDVNTRVNGINMQMLSKPLYEQVFRNAPEENPLSSKELEFIKDNLKKFQIDTEKATRVPNVDIQLPPLQGDNIEQHFYNIAAAQIEPYLKIINELMTNIPQIPEKWLLQEGWTRYTSNGVEAVDHPLEDGIIFDVEVCMKEGPLPTIATAVTKNAWYGWVSKSVIDGYSRTSEGQDFTTDMLIPMESNAGENGQKLSAFQKMPKIIVGHNVSFDRSKIKEQYWLHSTGTRFIDTMSMHICVSGINSYQRSILTSKEESKEKEDMCTYASLNNLSEVHKLYCGHEISKELRSTFMDGTSVDVKEDFHSLMTYCASDVVATHNILCRLFPVFQERFSHPVTLAGMLELGSTYLPVNSNWQRYLEEAEGTFEDLNFEAKCILANRANAVCRLMHNEKYKEDLWMWDQDWSTQTIKMKKLSSVTKRKLMLSQSEERKEESDAGKYLTDDENEEDPLAKEFAYLENTKYLLPARMPHMPGYPTWYRKLCPRRKDENWAPGPVNISTSIQVVPKLLSLTWENYPLHYIKGKGWGILVPYSSNPDTETNIPLKQLLSHCPLPNIKNSSYNDAEDALLSLDKDVEEDLCKTEFWWSKKQKKDAHVKEIYKGTGIWCNIDLDGCCYFFKLQHKDGMNCNVGNPLSKDFLSKFSENVLAGSDASATEILKIARTLSYWRNNRDRIMSQFVIWLEDSSLPSSIKKSKMHMRYGAILPTVVASGTLTRRAVERTWMTASNAHPERIGSELRSMVQAPPGYNIVGADVDSQELWIASLIGDAHYKGIHGATPFGWMTLIGTKSNGTDMHSITAKAVGISRDHAKVINYARIYGAGQKFAERLLKQFNPDMTDTEATSKSRKMFSLTKGKKFFKLKPEYVNEDMENRPYSAYEANRLAKIHSKSVSEMFQRNEWIGGSESAMFNRLEEIAGNSNPATPFLNSRLTRALENGSDLEKYLPTKVNWVVQSGAVDFLHLMLVSMRWLMKDNARFCLSFHDEIRYLVPSQYKYNAALAMHVTNLLTRSFCASKLGMKDLPMSVAFFTSVEVDTVLRKESTDDCVTPSNPHGLKNRYEIPPGESLNVWEAIEKSKGSLGSWHNTKNQKSENADQLRENKKTSSK